MAECMLNEVCFLNLKSWSTILKYIWNSEMSKYLSFLNMNQYN